MQRATMRRAVTRRAVAAMVSAGAVVRSLRVMARMGGIVLADVDPAMARPGLGHGRDRWHGFAIGRKGLGFRRRLLWLRNGLIRRDGLSDQRRGEKPQCECSANERRTRHPVSPYPWIARARG